MNKKTKRLIPFLLLLTFFLACTETELQEPTKEILDVDFTDGISNGEAEIIDQARQRVLDATILVDGKYNLNGCAPASLGISENLFRYISLNMHYLNYRIEQGDYLSPAMMNSTSAQLKLKAGRDNMNLFAITATEGDFAPENTGGGYLISELFEQATDWYKVYEEDGYTIWEYTNTTYAYETKYSWVDDPNIYNYYDNYYVYYNGGGGTSSIPNLPGLPKIIIDPTFKDTEAECVKNKLDNGKILQSLLSGFELDETNIELTFKVGDLTGANGKCEWNNEGKMEITIDTDRLNAPSIELARTILHESFHAYIFAKLYEEKMHTELCPEPDFERDFNDYKAKYSEVGSTQHNYMADKYLTYMKQGLNDYFNGETYKANFVNYVDDNTNWYGTDFLFECLAWGGLKGTEAWAAFSSDSEKMNKYNQTIGTIVPLLPKENCNN